ncbi:MAG: glycosyltransferase family 4 protein, partial [Acidimicrobiales bacterium]
MRLAFVSPRYGAGIVGGAEAHLRELAEGLAARGHQVRVLTTGALDPDSWENEAAPGVTVEDGVEVHRFESVPNPDRPGRDALDHRVLGGAPLGAADELAWVSSRYEAPGLVRHVAEEGARYEAIVYAPYLAWTTLRCLPVAPERSVLVPCLHDEPAARLRVVRAALAGAADVWFLSEPEHALAHRLVTLGEHCTVGGGVNVPERYDAEGFRHRHGLDRPFVLYAGRREDGKGWPGALGGITVATGRLGLDLDLVTIGSGAVSVPAHLIGRVVDLGRLDPSEVPDAFAAAAAHVQPSTLESFSRSVMESWLAGTVVVGNAAGAVVSWHCERSGGGLLYGDELEMAECFALVLGQPSLVAEMAARGRRYVLAEHLWPGVLDRAEEALDALVARREGAGSGAPESAAGEVRGRAARTRACAAAGRDSSAVAEDVPLAEWLPAPGLGVSPALVASPAGERPGSQVTGSPRPPR